MTDFTGQDRLCHQPILLALKPVAPLSWQSLAGSWCVCPPDCIAIHKSLAWPEHYALANNGSRMLDSLLVLLGTLDSSREHLLMIPIGNNIPGNRSQSVIPLGN